MRHPYFVPVRASQAGTLVLRTGQLPSGDRIGLAFTSAASLKLTLGPSQQWIRLAAEALWDMLWPLGVAHVGVDLRPVPQLELGTLTGRAVGDVKPAVKGPHGRRRAGTWRPAAATSSHARPLSVPVTTAPPPARPPSDNRTRC